MMKKNDGIRVEISGHTDSYGSKLRNKLLSLHRADAVRSFLTSRGIDPRRVTTAGYGEDKPLASNDDEKEGRELNRRVEFKVVGN
jgi:outer membrane protein OmpA-like peptidoglycan-associated protein